VLLAIAVYDVSSLLGSIILFCAIFNKSKKVLHQMKMLETALKCKKEADYHRSPALAAYRSEKKIIQS